MSDLVSFDYAIKYLLKDKKDYEIVEGFISALLGTYGYGPVKIKALLDGESNRESHDLKRSIADVIVEDVSGSKYIVEIDRSYTSSFMHKACFNTSRLIVDNLEPSADYSTITKIFHINLLYFPFRGMKSPLYHGKTIFHEVDLKHPQSMHLEGAGTKACDIQNIFPEYFIISVVHFNDVIKREIDEWLYMLKHSEVKENFKSPYMKKVAERLSILKMTKPEQRTYYADRNRTLKERDYIVSAEEKGYEEGLEKGMKAVKKALEQGVEQGVEKGKIAEKLEIATLMLREGDGVEKIMRITGLTAKEIEQLK